MNDEQFIRVKSIEFLENSDAEVTFQYKEPTGVDGFFVEVVTSDPPLHVADQIILKARQQLRERLQSLLVSLMRQISGQTVK